MLPPLGLELLLPLTNRAKIRNRLLSGLPAEDFAILAPRMTRVTLALGQMLHHHGDVIDQVYFVETGFISALTVLSDGQPLKIGLIGLEGLAGVTVVLGGKTSYAETMCQTGGEAYRMSADALREAFAKSPALRDLLLRYVLIFQVQVAQTAACNAHRAL